jgi:hypothetical protein
VSKQKAAELFRAFQEREPDETELVTIALDSPVEAMIVGELEGVIYRASGDGKKYIHPFAKHARPVLASSFDGKQLYILAGGYRFTARGIVDAPVRKRKSKR